MSSKKELKVIRFKIIVSIALISAALIIMFSGSLELQKEPYVVKTQDSNGIIKENAYSDYDLSIKFRSDYGLMPYRNITPMITVTLPEININSSSIQVFFPKGAIMNKEDNPGILRVGNPVQLVFQKNDNKISTYTGESYLIYYSEGDYDAEVKITLDDEQIVRNTIENVIHIGSWETYIAQSKANYSQGLTWIIVGIAMITTVPAFTRLVDLGLKYDRVKEKAFYE